MIIPRSRSGHRLHIPPAAILILATALLAACTRVVHPDGPAALHSETDSPPAAEDADLVERARPFVRAYVVEENIPGLSLAVGVAGKVVWAEGFGWADIDARRPVTPKTLFRIGSVAMPMTATAVGLLHERGLIDLDAPVRSYVPSFPEQKWPVTTRQLMGHLAGVRHYGDDEELLYMREHCESALDGVKLFADDRLLFPPGTDYEFSSYGWTLVGAVVEAAAHEPLLAFMQREVFEPLGMEHTVLDDRARTPADTTSFYWPFADRDTSYGIEDANNPDSTCTQGAAALLSTPSDVVRFGAAMLGGRLLRAGTLDLLRTPLALRSGESTGYGLGWFVRSVPLGPEGTTPAFGHGGISAGGTTSFLTLPKYGIVVAVTTNVSYAENLPSLSLRLAQIFAGVEADARRSFREEPARWDDFRPRSW